MKVIAFKRELQGSGASRRLRISGQTPGIVYGGAEAPVLISLDHNALYHALKKEVFHSSILDLKSTAFPSKFCCATSKSTHTNNWFCTLTSSALTRSKLST